MYGQGNYTPHFRQGPPQFQQGPSPSPFQQGPTPPPPVNHRGPSAPPSHLVPPGPPHVYHHGPPNPSPVQQAGPHAMVNTGQSYLHSSPSSYICSTMPPPNVVTQQNTQFPSPLPPPPGPAPSGPPPPRVLPPPPTQGPVLYRPLRPPPPPSITQGIQHGRPLPPPPPTGFIPVTPAPFASAVNTYFEKAQPPSMPPPPPPPPPSSPPPIPPSPPPCIPSPDISARSSITSSVIGVASEVSNHMESGSCTDKVSQSVERAIVSVDKGVGPTQTSYGLPIDDDYTQAGLPLSPPPRPAEKESVRQIEILCQHIVKNGPDFEIVVREKEIGNPRFAFLFGGDPGSDTAIAHQFFQWTKRKCLMESKLHNGSQQSNSLARHPETDSSFSHKNHTNDASHSPADSDMDMEDDIKHADRAQLNVELIKSPISMLNESVHARELQHDCQCSTEDLTATDASSRISFHQLPEEKREHGNVPSMVSAEAAEFTRGCTTQEWPRSCREDARLTRASPITAQTSCKVQETLKGGSPFRLIQGYASDDSSEAEDGPSFEDVSPVRVVESTAPNITCLQEDGCSNLDANISLENISVNETAEQGLVSATSMACRTPDISSETLTLETIASGPLVAFTKTSELQNDYNDKSLTFIDPSCKDVLKGGDHVDTSGKCQSDAAKQDSAAPEVDEFGRLIRKDATDSDSDAERYNGRRARRGRSRSPQDRWRKRSRSPRRRKDKRNRSSSWSPRKRRSRSKSPFAYRHGGEHGGEKMRRDKDQISDCFDFFRGRCYRGASCRYLHHGSNTSDMDRRYKGRQHHVDVSRDSRDFSVHGDSRSSGDTHETIPVKLSVTEQDMEKDGKSVEMLSEDLFVRSTDVPSSVVTAERIDSDPALMKKPPDFSIEVDQSPATLISEVCRSESQVRSALNLEKQQVDLAHREVTVSEHDSASEHLEETDKHLLAVTSPIQPISNAESHGQTSPGEHSLGEINSPLGKSPQPSQISKVSQASQDQMAANHPLPYELPLPLPTQVVNAQGSQPPSDCYLPSVPTNVLSQSALVEPPSHVPLHDEYSQSLVSQHSWTSLPPPPPPPSYAYGLPSTSVMHTPSFQLLQFPQNNVPLVRPYSHGVPSHSQAADFHHQTHPAADNLHQPPFHTEVTGAKRLHTDNTTNQPFGVPNYFKDERFKPPVISEGNQFNPGPPHDSSMHPRPQFREEHYPPLHVQNNVQNFQPLSDQRFASQFPGLAPTSSFAQDSIHSQPVQMQSFSDGNFLQRSFSREDYGNLSRENLPFTQRQQSPFGTQWSAADSFPTHMDPPRNANPSVARYQSSFLDTKQSHPSVLEGSKFQNSTHYNPFASAFDQPPGSSKFSSSFSQEIETKHSSGYDSFGVSQDSFGGRNIGDFGSRQMSSDSNRLSGMILPTAQSQFHRGSTGNDQYDPLFDSIEQSSKTINDSVTTLRPSSSQGPPNAEEEKQKQGASASPENDEFGETGDDVEVGAMESGSPDNPVGIGNTAAEDIEIDQVQTKGKSKKSKDSRSMKLFKVALADFVKEVLKPSWRQGNMSKEAFKTIVKKTVDKVSGAMKNHQIPKSQAKINQYVESSQRKLTKLVMGYVDKYVKS